MTTLPASEPEMRAFGHWTLTQLDEARKIAVEVMKTYGDLTGDEYERFLKNPWNDHCSVQAALRTMPSPFCGEPAEHDSQRYMSPTRSQYRGETGHAITCSKCEAQIGLFGCSEDAHDAWNKRATKTPR